MHVIVVGAGVVGAMSAWRLAAAGCRVTVLEQFEIDHDLGSSYGDSRIVRRVYPDSLYTALMARAYPLWDELQARTPETELIVKCGGVFIGPRDCEEIRRAIVALKSSGAAYEVLDQEACALRFPAMILAPGEIALFDPDMGYLRASNCVRAALRAATDLGAEIRCGAAVTGAARETRGVSVGLAGGSRVEADCILFAAGPWTGKLMAALGLNLKMQVTRQPYVHLAPESHLGAFEKDSFPVWIDAVSSFYGFPRLGDLPGVKVALHTGGLPADPATVDRTVREAERAALLEYTGRRFPWLSAKAVYQKVCLYTNTPDEDFIVDRVPGLDGSCFIGGLSGHGFKMAPLLGQMAADILFKNDWSSVPDRFRLARFGLHRTNRTGEAA